MKLRDASVAVVYAAADRFVDAALRSDGSLFTPGVPIWTRATLDDLDQRFVQRPDESSDSFLVKFQRQLDGAPDATLQLAAEALYVHFLISVMRGDAKRAVIQPVLGWMKEPISIPPDLDEALDHGIASAGTAFNTFRPFQLAFILQFARAWKALPANCKPDPPTPMLFAEYQNWTFTSKQLMTSQDTRHGVSRRFLSYVNSSYFG